MATTQRDRRSSATSDERSDGQNLASAAQLSPAVLSDRPAITVDVVILTVRGRELEVCLVKRTHEPYENMWALPGTFVHQNERLEDVARRELEKHAATGEVYLEQLYTFGELDRDPRMRVITVVYYALLRAEQIDMTAHTGSQPSAMFPVYRLPPLAFDHANILEYTIQRLRGKLEYTTIGFQLLASEFTLSELQVVYEAILNRPLDKRNFRKKLLATQVVKPTHRKKMVGQHRPAQLYRFNPDANR